MMVLMKTNPGLWHEKRCSEEEAVGALVQCQFPAGIPREGYITGITSGYALSTSKIKEFYILYIPRVDSICAGSIARSDDISESEAL